jgi:hypothetical protein
MTTHRALRCLRAGLLVMTATLALSHCNDDAVEAGPVSHDFIWEVDTLFQETFQYHGITIWGTSETNVYVGGHESDYGGRKSLFRYDGAKWNAIDLRRFGLVTINAISGIDSSNFIVVGTGGRWGVAGRYRNGNWDTLRLPWLRTEVVGVHMVSPSEIYICGVDGVLRHDGNTHTWIVDSSRSVFDPTQPSPFWPLRVRKGSDGKLYFVAGLKLPDGGYVFRMTMYSDGLCTVIDESPWRTDRDVMKSRYLRGIGHELLTGSNSVYSLSEGKYSLRHVIEGYFFTGADIRRNFFSSTRNKVMHFNGLDWHDVTPEGLGSASHRSPIEDALYLDGTLFLVTLHGYKTLIYRGKHIK